MYIHGLYYVFYVDYKRICDLIKLAYCLYTLFEKPSLFEPVNDSPSLALSESSKRSNAFVTFGQKLTLFLLCPRQKGPMHCNHAVGLPWSQKWNQKKF
jgi:hypothetical protein